MAERDLLASWAGAKLRGDHPAAEAAIARGDLLASLLHPGAARLLFESLAAIREAEAVGDAHRLALLARGYPAYAEAASLHRAERDGEALPLARRATADLARAGSPFRLAARLLELWIAADTAPEAEIRSLLKQAESRGFAPLEAEALRLVGWRSSLAGDFEAALDHYRASRDLYEKVGESDSGVLLRALRAEIFALQKRRDEACREALPGNIPIEWLARRIGDPYDRYLFFSVASSAALELGSPRAFGLRRKAVLACAELPDRPLCPVDAWVGFARRSPSPELVDRSLGQAESAFTQIAPSPSLGRSRTEAELSVARARWLARDDHAESDPVRAEHLLAGAAMRFRTMARPYSAALALDDRATILERLGWAEAAEAANLEALALARPLDRSQPAPAEATALPGLLRRLTERSLRLALARRTPADDARAFRIAEAMRERLAPWPMPRPFGAVDLDRLLDALPPRTAVVAYVLFAGARQGAPPFAVALTLAGGRLTRLDLAAGQDLARRLADLTEARRSHSLDRWRRASGALYEEWIAPVRAALPSDVERWIIIPDTELYALPWRGLWNQSTSRFLDEEIVLALAPSAGAIRAREAVREGFEGEILSVGFSDFGTLPLASLPAAPIEAIGVESAYGTSSPCTANDWAGFRRCAPRAEVIHLATHAVADAWREGGGWIAFGPEKVGERRLWDELPPLPNTRLVVLATCDSVATATGEGLGGLVRPFLARGARAVVGTLWNAGDRKAKQLFTAFHRIFAQQRDAAEALRRAREELDAWGSIPWHWAGVVALDPEIH